MCVGTVVCVIRPRDVGWVGAGVGGFDGVLWLVIPVLVVGAGSGRCLSNVPNDDQPQLQLPTRLL